MNMKLLNPFLFLIAAGASVQGVVSFTGNYFQDFNVLASTPLYESFDASAPTWTNDSTLPGWFGGGTGTLASGYAVSDGSDSSLVSSGAVAVSSFGTLSDSDRAFGPIKRNNISYIAVALTNNTAATLPELVISYTGEQWRDNTAATTGLEFSYQIGATDITSGTWTDVAALNFTGPQSSGSGQLDGNLAANRTSISSTLTGLNLNVGETVWLRWRFDASSNNGSFVSIDDLTVVPEPGTTALFVGFMAFAGILMRRRFRA